MYKAVHIQTGEEIIILNPSWKKRIEELRALDHADLLVCQGCRQPLRVKAGEVKRTHFAHKHLKACSYGSELVEILNARAVLYEWLLQEFPPGASGEARLSPVSVEKMVEGVDLPRPIDGWVEASSGAIAYWIIEAGIKLEARMAILAAFERFGVQVHFLFLQGMLNEKKEELHSLLLTPTERAFLQATVFDRVPAGAAEAGKSLHYLDADGLVLTSYRNLVLHHSPNWYKGVKKTSKLQMVRADRLNGEFIHRGEAEGLNAYRKRQARMQAKREKYQEREMAWSQRLSADRQGRGARWTPEPGTDSDRAADPLPCVYCGQVTSEYWSTFTDNSGRRLCRCRECLEREG